MWPRFLEHPVQYYVLILDLILILDFFNPGFTKQELI